MKVEVIEGPVTIRMDAKSGDPLLKPILKAVALILIRVDEDDAWTEFKKMLHELTLLLRQTLHNKQVGQTDRFFSA